METLHTEERINGNRLNIPNRIESVDISGPEPPSSEYLHQRQSITRPIPPSLNKFQVWLQKLYAWFRLEEFHEEDMVTSHFVSPQVLLGIRGLMMTYGIIILVCAWASSNGNFWDWAGYFTHLSYAGIVGYFIVSIHKRYQYRSNNI